MISKISSRRKTKGKRSRILDQEKLNKRKDIKRYTNARMNPLSTSKSSLERNQEISS